MEDTTNKKSFIEVIQRLEMIIERDTGKQPSNKQIAYELGLSATGFSNYKKRDSIPYKNIVEFCEKYNITINWILLGNSSIKLIEKEEKFYKIRVMENLNS